ncbi:hypothetical protein ACHQM5_020695 [Ranunculus cassubicifolius]
MSRPWAEDGSGNEYGDIYQTRSQAEHGRVKIGPKTEYSSSFQKSNEEDSSTRMQGWESRKSQVSDKESGETTGVAFFNDGIPSVPRKFGVEDGYVLCCVVCDSELATDMICPRCKCKSRGWLEGICCYICGEKHKADSCPDKDNLSDLAIDLDYEAEDDMDYEEVDDSVEKSNLSP